MYTSDDLVQIEQAIQKLQKGERVASVAYGEHSVRYAKVSLQDLLTLRQRMKAELQAPARAKRRLIFATHKGVV